MHLFHPLKLSLFNKLYRMKPAGMQAIHWLTTTSEEKLPTSANPGLK